MVPVSVHIIMAGFIFLLYFAVKESPRYLAKTNQREKAYKTMAFIRKLPPTHPYVENEMADVYE